MEGVFELTASLRESLGDLIPADAEDLVLARRVTAEGRTRALIGGRSATAGQLREVAEQLIAFTGQHEHRRLVEPRAQLELVDAAAGDRQRERLTRMAAAHERVRAAERELAELDDLAAERERRLDMARYELDEIERVDPQDGEAEELTAQRDRLRHLERLRGAAAAGAEAVDPDDFDARGISALAAAAVAELDGIEGVDAALDPLIGRFRAAALEFVDIGAELRGYLAGLEGEPGGLESVEQRLAELDRIVRKHGPTTADVLAHADECRRVLDELGDIGAARERLQRQLADAIDERAAQAAEVTAARTEAAVRLSSGVAQRLQRLAMDAAEFRIDLRTGEPGPSGADTAEFMLRANPGAPEAPLREVASGGELSRVLLALVGAAGGGADTSYVLDEIDAGIGGRTAAALGAELQHLADGRQVLCITHLPQVAALADHHSAIVKTTTGEATTTTITPLSGDAVTAELVRMLGAADDDAAAREHAESLRASRKRMPVVEASRR